MIFSFVPEKSSNYAEFANSAGRSFQCPIGELQFLYAIFAIPLVFLGQRIMSKNAKNYVEMADFVKCSCQFGDLRHKMRFVTLSVSCESVLRAKKQKNEEKYAAMRFLRFCVVG